MDQSLVATTAAAAAAVVAAAVAVMYYNVDFLFFFFIGFTFARSFCIAQLLRLSRVTNRNFSIWTETKYDFLFHIQNPNFMTKMLVMLSSFRNDEIT